MRISPETVARLQQLLSSHITPTQSSGASAPSAPSGGEETSVVLSPEVRLILLLHEMVKKLPEVDYQRVAQIQQQLQQGTYNPDTKAVAEAVLRELGV
jgi:negative regulator of flagellin synthesis FlgM